jgi:hypothetical protein
MSLVDRTGQLWCTRACFRTMYHPAGINKLPHYSPLFLLHHHSFPHQSI